MDRIYIPTFRRVNEQKTFERLPDKYKEKVIMVVQKDERPQYKYDVEYLEVDNLIGIAATRNEIYNHFESLGLENTFYSVSWEL